MSDSSGCETISKSGNCFFISLTTTSRCGASRPTNTLVTPRNLSGCPYSITGVWAKTGKANVKIPGKGMALLPSPSPKNRACHFHGTRLKHFKRPLRRTQYSNRSFVALLLRLYDSPLQTTHVAIGQLPFDGAPVNGLTQARASSARRRGFKFPTNSCLLRHRQRVSY